MIVISTMMGLVVGEYWFRKSLLSSSSYYIYPPFLHMTSRPAPGIMPGVTKEARFQTNSMGIRAEEIPPGKVYKILALGGSTTESIMIDQSRTWPYLLQTYLNESNLGNIWVGNGGKSALSTRHFMLEMKFFVPQVSPDAIIMLAGVNDLAYRLSRDQKYRPVSEAAVYGSEDLYQDTFSLYPQNNNDPFYKKLGYYKALRLFKRWAIAWTRHEFIDEAGKMYVERRLLRKNALALEDSLPDLTTALDEYEQNLRAIIRMANEKGIRIIFVTQPTMWQDTMPPELSQLLWYGGIGEYIPGQNRRYYTTNVLAQSMQLYNQRLLSVCASTGAECVDAAAILPKDTSVFYDDCHLNESGSQQLARLLADHFLHAPLQPKNR